MRMRFNFLAIGIALAILSFAYARYDYSNKNSVSFGSTKIGVTPALFGDWMKDEVVFAIVVPAVCIAGGVVLAIRK